jgi:putative ABC transport system permease protein
MWKRGRSLLRALMHRGDFERAMSEELGFHVEEYTEDLKRSGVPADEARRRARMELGGLNGIKGDCRQARGLPMFDELVRELRYAARLLRKSPGFTATALLTLAVCIGANLTMFAAIDSVLLRPLPFPDAERLVMVFNTYPKAGVERDGSSPTNYYERRGHLPAFSALAIYRYGTAIIGEAGSTKREEITRVSPDFFATLGRGPVIGRAFTDEETTYQTDNVAILTDAYWRQHFHTDPRTIGRQIRVDGVAKTVIGILPAGFRFLSSEAQLYFPLASSLEERTSSRHSGGNVIQMIARLKPGVTLMIAQAQIDAQNAALEKDDPQATMMAAAGFRSVAVPLRADHVAAIRPTLLLMQVGVLVLLLIGVVNLLNLLLIRASGRMKELAVRRALGASGRHVVSEVMVETLLLTLAGGILGLAVGAGGIRLLAVLGADRLPLGAQIAFDARMALAGLVGAVVLGAVLTAPIAWFHLSGHLANALQSETRGSTTNRAAQRIRHSFIAGQIALAVVLLSGAGLLGLSLKRAMEISPGFRPSHVLSGQISLPGKNYPDGPASLVFIEKLINETGGQPGVSAAGVVTNIPFSGNSGKSAAKVKGYVPPPGESPRGHYAYGVGGDYFGAMGFSLLEGRFLTQADSRRAQRVCVVDEDFARYYWPHASALGQRLFEGSDDGKDADAFTVVGVVGSVKQAGLTDEQAQGAVYYPYSFHRANDLFVVARTSLPVESFGPNMQRLVRHIDPDLPITDVRPMETRIADSLIARRSPALLAGLFSAIALLLTAIGTYGVLSYAVAQRRREIGVRMALGARPAQIRRQFALLGLRLLAGGIVLGVIGAWLAGRAMQTVLFHVPALNLITLAGAAGIMAAVSLAACLLPSQRAARISPMEALADQ